VYGARPISKWMQKYVLTVLSEMVVSGEAGEGSTISIDATYDKKQLKYQALQKEI
jgi:ATP-dependent Clp protease ATP-binding subunit ClpA